MNWKKSSLPANQIKRKRFERFERFEPIPNVLFPFHSYSSFYFTLLLYNICIYAACACVCVCICCYFPIQNSGNKVKERSMLFDFIFISITIGFPSFQWRYNRNAALQAHINRSIRFIHPSTLIFMTIFFFVHIQFISFICYFRVIDYMICVCLLPKQISSSFLFFHSARYYPVFQFKKKTCLFFHCALTRHAREQFFILVERFCSLHCSSPLFLCEWLYLISSSLFFFFFGLFPPL